VCCSVNNLVTRGQATSDADASEYSMPYLPFLFLNPYLCTVPVHFYELRGAGTLFVNNQRCRDAAPLRPKAL